MNWEVGVTGPENVVAELAHAFRCAPDLRLEHAESGWVLQGSRFDPLPNAQAVHAEAALVVRTLSGVTRLCLGAEAALSVGVVWGVKPDGSRSPTIFPPAAEAGALANAVSLTLTHADGTVEELRPSDPAPAWLRAALASPDLVKALRLRDAGRLSWSVLPNILEVIQKGTNGKKSKGWPTKREISRFTGTAGSPDVVGDEARHGVQHHPPPEKTMSLAEARLFIDRMLVLWLENTQPN
jgi:hypothetical protein